MLVNKTKFMFQNFAITRVFSKKMEYKKHIFSDVERNIFKTILKKYSHVVECKKVDGPSLQRKNIAWDRIAGEYNANPVVFYQATSKQLRRLWMNLKQRQRDKRTTVVRPLRPTLVDGPPEGVVSEVVIDPDGSQSRSADGLLVSVGTVVESDTLPGGVSVKIDPLTQPSPNVSPGPSETSSSDPNAPIYAHPVTSYSNSTPLHVYENGPNVFNDTNVLQVEYDDKKRRIDELHIMEIDLMQFRLRKAKSEAELAEYILEKNRNTLIRKEYDDRKRRADELHAMEIDLMRFKLRKAKAEAELAELILEKNISST